MMKQLVLKELSKIDFEVVIYLMRDYKKLNDLVTHLAWCYNREDIVSGKMTAELQYAYECDK